MSWCPDFEFRGTHRLRGLDVGPDALRLQSGHAAVRVVGGRASFGGAAASDLAAVYRRSPCERALARGRLGAAVGGLK